MITFKKPVGAGASTVYSGGRNRLGANSSSSSGGSSETFVDGSLGMFITLGQGSCLAAGVYGVKQITMYNNRMSLPISSKIGTFSSFCSKYGKYGVRVKTLGALGNAAAFVSVYSNTKSLQNDEIGLGRYSYRLASIGTSAYIGSTGGPLGAVGGAGVGIISFVGEIVYDNVITPLSNKYLVPILQRIQFEMDNFQNSLINGYVPAF